VTALAPVAGTVVALTFLVGLPAAAEPAQPDRRPVSDRQALLLLTRATKAARATPYAGVQFVSRWSASGTTSLLVDVRHVPGEGTLMQVRGTSAGPGSAVFTPSETEAVTGGPATGGGPVGLLARNYSVVPAGYDTVAGRSARVLESRRRDGSVAGRFWLDDGTALLLRREVFDRQGATVRAGAFIGITLGVPQLRGHLPPMPGLGR
jgi:hypothetical protein